MLERVPKFNFTAFEADTFGLKIDFHTESLFGYESHIRNMGDDDEYMFSCRAVVDLMNPVYGQDLETAREGLSEFVLEWMRGIGREEVSQVAAGDLFILAGIDEVEPEEIRGGQVSGRGHHEAILSRRSM